MRRLYRCELLPVGLHRQAERRGRYDVREKGKRGGRRNGCRLGVDGGVCFLQIYTVSFHHGAYTSR